MKYPDQSYHVRIELDTKNCELTPEQIAKMERMLEPLRDPTRSFPVCDLYVTVAFHPRSNRYHVRTSLVLSGRTLSTAEHANQPTTAFEQCIGKLVRQVSAYKDDLAAKPEVSKEQAGTRQDVQPSQLPDADEVQAAVEDLDYARFRRAMFVYEESLRKRVGRWIQRYPEAESQLDTTFSIADIVEEVFLNAFENFPDRPQGVPLSQWLEDLIDPSLRLLIDHTDEELENIQAVRSLQGSTEQP